MASPQAVLTEVEQFVAFASNALGALLGLNYYALLYAFLGALVAVMKSEKINDRIRLVVFVIASTLVGAIMGTASAEYLLITRKSFIAMISLCCGLWWQALLAIVLTVIQAKGKAIVEAVVEIIFGKGPPK